MKRGLNPKDVPCISKRERVTAIFVDQVTTKSQYLKIFKSQYLSEFLRYGSDFLHLIIDFIGSKITFKVLHHSFWGGQNDPSHLAHNLKYRPLQG